MRTASSTSPAWQLTKWSLGDGGGVGRNSLNAGLLPVCSETDSWENPMTLKPSLSLLTEKNRSQNKAHPETSLTAQTNSLLAWFSH